MPMRLRERPEVQRRCGGGGACRCDACGDEDRLPTEAAQLIALQRQAGNRAVSGLMGVTVQRGFGELWEEATSAISGVGGVLGGVADAAAGTSRSIVAALDDMSFTVGTAPPLPAGGATASLGGVESLPPGAGSGTGPRTPGQQLGDTPGSRTADETAGVRESEGGAPVMPITMAWCLAKQAGRVLLGGAGGGPPPPTDAAARTAAQFQAKKLGICAIAKCLPARLVVKIIEDLHFSGQPQAVANLDHYIEGSGAAFPQPMARLLADPGVRETLTTKVAAAAPTPGQRIELSDPINQGNYTSEEWLNALGNVDWMAVTVLDDPAARAANAAKPGTTAVQVELRDPYQWHPRDPRVTQCLHELFEAMKKEGAAEYDAVGTGPATLDLTLVAPPRAAGGEDSRS